MLGQSASAFSLEDAFRTPKIVLVAANAGLNGQEASRLLGGLLLSQCWGVIQRQAAVPMAKRRPVMVMVDELSDFTAGLDVAELLQKARSANVSFVAAHQHLGQFSRELRAAMAANARNRVTFRPSIDDAKALGELFGVPSETLLGLDGFRAVASVLVGNRPSSAFEIQTLPPPTPVSDPETVALASLNRYGRLPTEVDAALLARWQGTATASPVGRKKRGGAA
ncbi:TraM-binding TraD/TraG-like protein [Actinokineospora spheciospongiae]|nr:TraM-binding TraD/TraG-like protein [Actinokineospora spheciospongiae]